MKTRDANEVLTKIRKGATADFNVQDWLCCLDALGWRWTKHNDKGDTAYDITAPNDQSFWLKKESGYRRIVFYDFLRWAKEQGLMFHVEAKIGAAPVKKSRQETEENTGTCPCCFGGFKLRDVAGNPGMVIHGYKRPGCGYIISNCHGVNYLPYELSCSGTRVIRSLAEHHVNMLEAQLGLLRAQPETLYIAGRNKEERVVPRGSPSYNYELSSKIQHVEWEIRSVRKDIALFITKIDTWTLQPLPGTVRP